MTRERRAIVLRFADTSSRCSVGETLGKRGPEGSKIPVLSCEGARIRGEIAIQAANLMARGPSPDGP